MQRRDRSSNFELMRIFAMFLIITYHYALFSAFRFPAGDLSFNRLFYQSMFLDGKTGVNLFVMVSGYFMVKSERIRTSKVLQLWGQAFFYIVGIWIIFHKKINGMGSMVQDTLKGKLFFLSSGVQWFISTYIVMYLLAPYMNAMLKALSRDACRRLLVLMGALWCLIPTLSWIPGMVVTEFQGSDLAFFLFLYCLGGYLRLYHEKDSRGAEFWFGCAGGIFLLCMGVIVSVDIWNTRSLGKVRLLDYLFNYQNHVLILLLSLFLFLGFKELKVRNSSVINLISSLTFGIYLIHDNWQIRRYLWNNVIKGPLFQESPWFLPVSLGIVTAVFCCCGALELLRQLTVEKLWMKAAAPISDGIDKLLSRIIRKGENENG